MEPEKLKIIAEGMGYERVVIAKDCNPPKVMKLRVRLVGFERDEYNPLTNNDQMVKIMEKCKICVMPHDIEVFWEAYLGYKGKIYEANGKTINEAVCNAAYEHYKAVK